MGWAGSLPGERQTSFRTDLNPRKKEEKKIFWVFKTWSRSGAWETVRRGRRERLGGQEPEVQTMAG